ncbi:PREDICTED: uncharacterized protein LOC106810102 [Priapulus caudatus]|uniref:Uncharacterized protein LOC106810102 n=1 Tax=Priapulus caudatus TaxID=37621 RepID=A0ABM1E9I9_PRICU|nr:PREDICTED: uncharacterized protein LOC106810102 [Priapulus caudatus]
MRAALAERDTIIEKLKKKLTHSTDAQAQLEMENATEKQRAHSNEMGETNKKFHEASVGAEKMEEDIADLKSEVVRAEDAEDKLTPQLASLGKTHRRKAESLKVLPPSPPPSPSDDK